MYCRETCCIANTVKTTQRRRRKYVQLPVVIFVLTSIVVAIRTIKNGKRKFNRFLNVCDAFIATQPSPRIHAATTTITSKTALFAYNINNAGLDNKNDDVFTSTTTAQQRKQPANTTIAATVPTTQVVEPTQAVSKQRRYQKILQFARRFLRDTLTTAITATTTYPFRLGGVFRRFRRQRNEEKSLFLLMQNDENKHLLNDTTVSSEEMFQTDTSLLNSVTGTKIAVDVFDSGDTINTGDVTKYHGNDDCIPTSVVEAVVATASMRQKQNESTSMRMIMEQWNDKQWNIIVSNDFLLEYDTYLQQLGQPFIVRSIAKQIIGQTTEETDIHVTRYHDDDDDNNSTEQSLSLSLRSINAKGKWDRTLLTSGVIEIINAATAATTSSTSNCCRNNSVREIVSNYYSSTNDFKDVCRPPGMYTPPPTVVTADNECVSSEAYWINIIAMDADDENGNNSTTTRTATGWSNSTLVVHYSWLRGVTKYGGGDFESIRYIQPNDSNNDTILVCHSTFYPSTNPQQQQRAPAFVTWRFRCRN